MLDYDREAASYDETRGGRGRAEAAAAAIVELAPGGGLCLDVAGGTGIVSAELAGRGWDVVVVDQSVGMLALAADRLPGTVLLGDASRLPVASGSVDLVVTLWLLHLLAPDVAEGAVREAARLLRPGGVWVTSVDKEVSHGRGALTLPDREDRVLTQASALGLSTTGRTCFESRTPYGTGTGSDVATFWLTAFARDGRERPVAPRA